MACYTPLSGYRAPNGKVLFKPIGYYEIDGKPQFLTVPCGQCMGCRLERRRQWAVRCMHELQLHDTASFLTLTYDDQHLPPSESLQKDDLTKFIKRLRKAVEPVKIRYFACGEYGETTQRPHYHMILYGYQFPDEEKLTSTLKKSDTLARLWSLGNCSIGNVTFESCAYVAGYITEKLSGKMAKEAYDDNNLVAPYVVMSRRPGIAADWFAEFQDSIFPRDEVVVSRNGCKILCKPPKYYDKLYEKIDPADLKRVKELREARAQTPAARARTTGERLFARQEIDKARSKERNLKKL